MAPPDSEEETHEVSWNSEEKTKDVVELTAGLTDLEGPVVPTRRQLTISGNLPPNNVIAHVESTGARRSGRSGNTTKEADEEGDEESASMCDGGGAMILQMKVEILEPIARGMSPEESTGRRR